MCGLYLSSDFVFHIPTGAISQRYVNYYQRLSSVVVIYNQPIENTWQAGLYRFADDIGQYIATNEGYINLRTKALVGQEFIESVYDIVISAYGEDIYSKELALSPSSFSLDEHSPVFQQINLSSRDWSVLVSLREPCSPAELFVLGQQLRGSRAGPLRFLGHLADISKVTAGDELG